MSVKDVIEISGKIILPGENQKIKSKIARLPSGTEIEVPAYVYRSAKPGPVVLLSGGLHGDEINGIEIVRRMLEAGTFDHLLCGSIVAVPVMNIYGFLNFSRDVPDGKDINRSFPGHITGSLAARFAHFLTEQIISQIDLGVDFHTGGASRYNHPQVRYAPNDPKAIELANSFGAPLILQSRFIEKSLRKEAFKKGKSIIVYEGGESMRLEEPVVQEGINGAQRLLKSLGMLSEAPVRNTPTIHIESSTWLRAKRSGIYQGIAKSGTFVKNRELLGYITDPFGEFRLKISSKQKAFVIGHNNMPIVNQGDALLHLGILKDPLTQG